MILQSKALAIALAFSASLCKAIPADPTITAPPILSKREAYDYYDFIGNYATAGASSSYYTASTCAGTLYREKYVTSLGYFFGGCESSSYYSVFTECYGSTAYGIYSYSSGTYTYSDATSTTCTGFSSCIADTIKYSPDGSGSSYFIKCADTSPRTLYRTNTAALPLLQSVTLTSSSSTTSTTTTSSGSQTTITKTATPSPTPRQRKSIAGPVAGGVIGGLAFLALVAFLIWFFVRKRQIRNSAANSASAYAQSQPVMIPQQPGYPPGPGLIAMPEKTAMPPTSPVSPYSQQEAWAPAMGGHPGITPSTSPPPTYFHQSQPMYPPQQSQQVSYPQH
ncbi:hypothetical protein DL98DRAFT_527554 [Cadophora sp. DSE1049]|nr:hypothetical protein DL98DRAFT_527554 [Cadophora sp. DSE1049]